MDMHRQVVYDLASLYLMPLDLAQSAGGSICEMIIQES